MQSIYGKGDSSFYLLMTNILQLFMKRLFTQFVIMIMNDILFNVMTRYNVCTYVIIILFISARNIRLVRQTHYLGIEKVLAKRRRNLTNQGLAYHTN
jgi:hypothetical protein